MFELTIYFTLRQEEVHHAIFTDNPRTRIERVMQTGLWLKAGEDDLYIPPHQILRAVCKKANEVE